MSDVYSFFGSALSMSMIIMLTISNIVLLAFVFKKNKALMLSKFTMGVKGIELTYEINKDKKLELVVLENIALQKEIEILKSDNKKKTFQIIGILMIALAAIVITRIKQWVND